MDTARFGRLADGTAMGSGYQGIMKKCGPRLDTKG